jgi:hypothetical protein
MGEISAKRPRGKSRLYPGKITSPHYYKSGHGRHAFSSPRLALFSFIMSCSKPETSAEKPAQIEHVDGVLDVSLETTASSEGAINTLLILACIAFGSASFVFGFDDKIISPLAALPEFVRPHTSISQDCH